jgi:phage shock protein C
MGETQLEKSEGFPAASGEQPAEKKEEVPTVSGKVISPGPKRLLRSRQNRMVAGVCGGIAEYFSLDPVLVRALWAVLTLVTAVFPGVALYILALFIVPEDTAGERGATPRPRVDNRMLWGALFVAAGLYFLTRAIWGQVMPAEWLNVWNRFWDVVRSITFPAVLIGVGILLVLGISRRTEAAARRLARPRQGRVFAGVCSGIGHYFGIDPVWVRVVWVLLFVASWWAAVVLYVLAMLLMPEE